MPLARHLGNLHKRIDALTECVGQVAAALTVLMALVTAIVVVFRYFLDGGSIALQESIVYLHAAVFLCGASVGLKHSAHVRVDIVLRNFNLRQQAWVNVAGSICLLLPLCLFIVGISWHYVAASWAIQEVSSDAGGLPFVWLLKTLMPIGGALLGLQALAELARNLAQLLTPSATPATGKAS